MSMTRRLAALIVALSIVTGCGGGSGGSGDSTPAPDDGPPIVDLLPTLTAQVAFPPTAAATEASSITVRGSAASTGSAVSSVRVNGVAATSNDGFQSWQASVPLTLGWNFLTVEVEDGAANRNPAAAELMVSRTALLPQPRILAVDVDRFRVLAFDAETKSLSSLASFGSGLRSLLSSAPAADDANGIRLNNVVGMAVDSARNRVLVLDTALIAPPLATPVPGIVAVDLNTGARTLFSSSSVPDNVNAFQQPSDLVLNEGLDRALVVDNGLNALIAVSLADGSRTILSGPSVPDSVNPLSIPSGLAVDVRNNRALVVDDGLDAVVAVDFTTGARSILSDGSIPSAANALSQPTDIIVDAFNNRALVSDTGLGALVSVRLDDGARTIVTDRNRPDAVEPFVPLNIAFISSTAEALVTSLRNSGAGAIVTVSLMSGSQALNEDPTTQTDVPFTTAIDVAVDAANDRVLVLDSLFSNQIVALNRGSGVALNRGAGAPVNPGLRPARAVLARLPSSNDRSATITPVALALDITNNRALATYPSQSMVATVDLTTSATSALLDPNGSANILTTLAVDETRHRAFFAETMSSAILAADLADPLLFSPSIFANIGPTFMSPVGVAVDPRGRVLVTDRRNLLAIDPNGGSPTVLASAADPRTVFARVVVDPLTNHALIVDTGSEAVIAVSLIDGAISQIAGGAGGLNAFTRPRGIAFDPQSNCIFVTLGPRGIVVIDKPTGERVFF